MGTSPVDFNTSFVAPTPIKWRQALPFNGGNGTAIPAIQPVKKESEQKTAGLNPFSVTNFNLGCPRRDFDTIDLLG